MTVQRILIPLFIFVWWNRLHYFHPYQERKYRVDVIRVKGWRTAIVDTLSNRETVTFMFRWETP